MPQEKYVVRVQSENGQIFNIEVRADSEAQAMTKAKGEDFVKRVIQAWKGSVN